MISCLMFHTKTHYTRMNIKCHVTNVYFNGVKPTREFKINEYTHFAYLKYILQNLLSYADNQNIVKLEYHSTLIANECKIEFNNCELKIGANLRSMWSIFFPFRNKSSNRGGCDDLTGQRYYENVGTSTRILKCNV